MVDWKSKARLWKRYSLYPFVSVVLISCVSPLATSKAFTPSHLARYHSKSIPSRHAVFSISTTETSLKQLELDDLPVSQESRNKLINWVTKLRGGESTSSETINKKKLLKECIAELIGTFLIVSLGTGSVMSAVFTDSLVGLFQIAVVWIIAVTIAISTTATISGAHLNPAVSIAFAMIRPADFAWSKVLPFTIAQMAGAILGSWTVFTMYASSIVAFEETHQIVRSSAAAVASAKVFGEYISSSVSIFTAFLSEAIGTGLLAFVIFALTHPKNDTVKSAYVPSLIGMTVGALIAVIAPLTQAGFNPARDFGPRIVAFLAGWKGVAFQNWWVYVLGPIVGAPIGAALADKVLYADD